MKVLWLSPTPSLGENYLSNKPVNGGWIKSLEKGIQDKVDLSIIFYHFGEAKPFVYGKSKYFPVSMYKKGRLSKIKSRILNSIESIKDIDRFLSIIEEVQPDLIHIHGTEGPYGLVQKYTDIPCVVSIQGCISVILYRYFSGITYSQAFKFAKFKSWLFLRTFIHTYYQYLQIAKREKEIFRNTKHIIGRTAWDKRISKVLAPKARYSHNDEILRDVFYQTVWHNELQGKLCLFTTCGPAIYKGLETILYAAHLLDLNEIDYQWEIAGLSEDDELVVVATKSIGKPRSPNVIFTGILGEGELVDKLLKSHLYISPSHIENSPNSLCEALILGIPCIATNAGGTPSLFDDGVEGILIQDGDPYAMTGAVMELSENYERAKKIGKRGRQRALERHDPEKIVADLLGIYDLIYERANRKRVGA